MAPWNPVYKGLKAYQIIVEISTGIQKDKVQSVKDWKNTKRIQKYSAFFCILFVFFRIFLYFYKKKYEKNTKKVQKIRMQLLKNTKYKKIRINNFKNTKNKKNTNPKFQKYKIQRKEGFAIESGSLEFDFFRWIHMYADCLARSHYIWILFECVWI